MSGAAKILMGSGGVDLPSDDEFNRTSFLSHFDGANNGTNIVYDDSSASNHTVSVNATPQQGTFSPFSRVDGEWSNYFDGSGDYLDIASSSDFAYGTADFTWECFFFLAAPITHSNYIIEQGSSYDPALSIQSDGHLNWMDNSSGVSVDIDIAEDVTLNVWHHVAISRASGTLSFYYDGTRATTTTTSSDFGANTVRIGNHGGGGSYEFNGYLSNVRIVKGTAVYSGTSITVPTSALTAISGTVLLTCQSNRFIDNSASAHALTTQGSPRAVAFTPILTSKVYDSAVNGASAWFIGHGTGTNITVDATGSDFTYGTGAFTIEGWYYWISGASSYYPFIYAMGNMMQFYRNGGNTLWYLKLDEDAGSWEMSATVAAGTVENQWNHFAVTRSGSDLSVFINGVRVATESSVSGSFDGASGGGDKDDMYLGSHMNNSTHYPMGGYMSDFRILKGTALYDPTSSTCTVPTAPLTAITNTKLLLNMADGQAIDSSAEHNLVLLGNADTSTTQQKFGTASLALDGTGDAAQIQGVRDFAGDFTIECWARTPSTSTAFLWNVGQYTMELGITGDILRLWTGSYTSFFTGGEFTVDTWHHVAVVRNGDGTGNIKVYLDGTASSTTISDNQTFVATSGIFYIGGEWTSSTSVGTAWNGYVDDFRISRFARYTSNFTPSTEAFPDKGQ